MRMCHLSGRHSNCRTCTLSNYLILFCFMLLIDFLKNIVLVFLVDFPLSVIDWINQGEVCCKVSDRWCHETGSNPSRVLMKGGMREFCGKSVGRHLVDMNKELVDIWSIWTKSWSTSGRYEQRISQHLLKEIKIRVISNDESLVRHSQQQPCYSHSVFNAFITIILLYII